MDKFEYNQIKIYLRSTNEGKQKKSKQTKKELFAIHMKYKELSCLICCLSLKKFRNK